MELDDFINRVQVESKLAAREQAITIAQAVLETLGERLDRKVRNGVAAQLPRQLKEFFLARSENTDRYELSEFYNRVGARADLNYQDAVKRTRQVFSVLRQTLPPGEIEDISEDLPGEYAELLESDMSPA